MATARNTRAEFDALSSRVKELLTEYGLQPIISKSQDNEWDGCYAKIAKWENGRPAVAMYSGKYFRDNVIHFWFGFESPISIKIDDIISHIGPRSNQIPRVTYTTVNEQSPFTSSGEDQIRSSKMGVVETESDGRSYYGKYDIGLDSSSHSKLAGDASRFIGSVVLGADPLLSERRDIALINRSGSTERTALILARRGQGIFRRKLEVLWGEKCSVSSCKTPEVLRASHIMSWKDADDKQRLDSENGLLLIATLDALFDKHLISFNDDGAMLVSGALNENDRVALLSGMPGRLRRTPRGRQFGYLKYHREESLKKWSAPLE